MVLLLLALSYNWSRVADPNRFSWMRQMGHTSLLVYWMHIEVVYGRHLKFIQHRLDQGQAVAAIVCLGAAMLGLSVIKTRWSAAASKSPSPRSTAPPHP